MDAFHTFVNQVLANQTELAMILNGYTTFLMADKTKRDAIKDYRMDWFVNNYINYDNIDKRPYYEYYKNNIKDTYPGVFDPSSCLFSQMCKEELRQKELEQKEYEEYYNDDIAMHYREIGNRHLTRWDMMKEDSECMSVYEESETSSEEPEYDSYISEYDDYDDKYYEDDLIEYEEDDYDY